MAIPSIPTNLTAEQSDGNILLTWTGSVGATGYQIQRSTDGVNFSNLAAPGIVNQYVDSLPGIGIMYWYQVAGINTSGTSAYSNISQMVAALPSEMSLFEIRLRSQQTADRVCSQFVTDSEWNSFLRLAMYELYDLLITAYEDLFASSHVFINTNGNIKDYPLPDGVTNYPGGVYDGTTPFVFTLNAPVSASINAVYKQNDSRFTVQSTIAGGTILSVVGNGTPNPYGALSLLHGVGDPEIVYSSYALTLPKPPALAFYKLAGMDLGINTSNNAWVTLLKYDFIERNKYVYPNSISTIYGVYNMRYRLMGNYVNIIPTPAGNQQIRMWYSPKLPALLKDTDLTSLGYSGWLRYVIVRAARYALSKEEGTDTAQLDSELLFLKTRIEQSSQNRDNAMADTISATRQDPVYGGNGFGGGGTSAGW